jgi:hypothetical protein
MPPPSQLLCIIMGCVTATDKAGLYCCQLMELIAMVTFSFIRTLIWANANERAFTNFGQFVRPP